MPSLSRHRSATLSIEGQPIRIQITRLVLEEAERFRTQLKALMRDQEQDLSPDQAAYIRAAFHDYVSLAPGELDVDGTPVLTGDELLTVIGEDPTLVMRGLLAIAGMSMVSRDEGKPSASGFVSVPPSDALDQAPDGPRPETTVGGAAPPDTTETAAAMAATA